MIYSPSWHSKHVWLSFFRTKNSMGPVLFGPQRSAFCIFCFCVLQKEGWKSYNSRGLVIDVGILSNYFLSISLSFSKEATVFLGLAVDENAKRQTFPTQCLCWEEVFAWTGTVALSVSGSSVCRPGLAGCSDSSFITAGPAQSCAIWAVFLRCRREKSCLSTCKDFKKAVQN